MLKKSTGNEEEKNSEYFRQVKAAQGQEKTTVTKIVTSLRTDMVPASDVQPAKESVIRHEYIKAAVGILLGIVVVGIVLYLGIGPGRPILEQSLESLVGREITPTFTASLTQIPPTHTQSPPTKTPSPPTMTSSPSPTHRPTNTQVIVIRSSPTPITPTPTTPGCKDVLSISLSDVGKALCVKGIVIETINHPSGFIVIFSTDPGSFYWISYDWNWTKAKLNTCYQITGEIYKMGNTPILLFGYHNQPEVCP
jgi:hypothetical protein